MRGKEVQVIEELYQAEHIGKEKSAVCCPALPKLVGSVLIGYDDQHRFTCGASRHVGVGAEPRFAVWTPLHDIGRSHRALPRALTRFG